MAQIIFDKVSVGYDNKKILTNLNFKVEQGDYLCIIGENGSGKSTLMKTLLGLQPAISGKIKFDKNFNQTEIGYLPQQTEVQRDFPAYVKEIVISGCQARCGLRPFYSKEEREIANSNMKKMNILKFANKSYKELSGGQQQRVLLARALCATQKCLLLDEPVTGLDPKVTLEMYELIENLNKEGITIIMISHDITAVKEYASHVLYVGKNMFFGTKNEFIKSDIGKFYINEKEGELKCQKL